jgi:hypothetical protein
MKLRKQQKRLAARIAAFEAMANNKDSRSLYFILQGRGFHKPGSNKK